MTHASEDLVTIHVNFMNKGKYQLPRATYVMPTGQHDMERWDLVEPAEAQHYSVRLIEHGPFLNSLQACQYGTHTHCRAGEHKACPFQPGKTHEHGSVLGREYLEHRDERGHWRPMHDETGRAIRLLPEHVWYCACDCHTPVTAEPRYIQEAFTF